MRLRNLGMIALVATTITLAACSSSEADSSESQATADASSREEVSENSEEAAQAELAAELQAQGWNGPLDLDASQLDYGMGEVTIEGEVIPMTVTCYEMPYTDSPFYLDAYLEGIDSAGRPVEARASRSVQMTPWSPDDYRLDTEDGSGSYDGYEGSSFSVDREAAEGRRYGFSQMSPGHGDPHAEGLPVMKATDDWRFSAVVTTDDYASSPSDFAFPIEMIGMCQEDWVGPFALSREEWNEREGR